MTSLFTQEEVTEIALNEARREGKEEGRLGVFYELVRDNLLLLCIAADKAGQSEQEFTPGMEAYFAKGNIVNR